MRTKERPRGACGAAVVCRVRLEQRLAEVGFQGAAVAREADQDAAVIAESDQALLLFAAAQRVERIADHLFMRREIVITLCGRIGDNALAKRLGQQCDDDGELLARNGSRIAADFYDRDPVECSPSDIDLDTLAAIEPMKRIDMAAHSAIEGGAFRIADAASDDEEKCDGTGA